MKKIFLFGAMIALALVSCKKEDNPGSGDPVKNLVYDGAAKVVIQEGTNFYSLKFTANKDWAAQIEVPDSISGKPAVSIDKTKGTAGEQTIKVTFDDLAQGQTGRLSTLAISTNNFKSPDDGEFIAVAFIQGKVFTLVYESDEVGVEGGTVTYKIITNSEDVKCNHIKSDWATSQWNSETDEVILTAKANNTYDPRTAEAVFVISDILRDSSGVKVPSRYSATIAQAGNAKLAWAKSISSSTSSFPVGSLVRLCHNGDEVAICYDQSAQAFDKATGAVKAIGQGVGATNYVSDAAGHMVYSNTATYQGESGADILRVCYIGDGMDQPKEIINYKHQDVYSSTLGNLRVYGDVTKDAVVCAMTDLYVYCIYWEIKNGVVGAAQNFALPSVANWETYEGIVWNAERGACVVPMGTTAEQGFLYMGYDTQYNLFAVDKSGTSQSIFSFNDYMGGSYGDNVNFQCISVANFNGSLYALVGVSTYFNYGNCPDLMLFDIANAELVSYINHWNYDIPVNYIGANDGENAAADVLLLDEGDKMGAYMADLLNDVIYKVEFPKL